MKTTIQETGFESEDILQDNYPVYYGYAYLADKKVVQSHITGTVADLKRKLNASEIRRCNIVDRSKAPFFGKAGIGIGKDLATEKTSEAKTTGVIGSLLSLAIAEVVYYYAGIFELF